MPRPETTESTEPCDKIDYLGIDGPSVDAVGDDSLPAHRILLEAGVVIVEGLDLNGVPAGRYTLVCMPLKIKDCDGAPARVMLLESEASA